jgi:hypothetical protein
MKTPVVFIIFKRPDTTEKVFEVIRQVQPPKLLVIADGPRADQPGEAEKCAATRAIIDRVDWDCEVLKNYADVNMGCKWRVSSGLDWAFNIVEQAIILEDDCLPDPSFFRFCDQLLEKYKDDERIVMICGTNILEEWKSEIQSYHFSYFGSCWGWASWRRAWQYYDVTMKLWSEPEVRNRIRDVIADEKQYIKCQKFFDSVYCDKIDAWAYRWFFARLLQSGLLITPSVNLVTNIGFSKDSTHTKGDPMGVGNLPRYSMKFPLQEPYGVTVDRGYDYYRYMKEWDFSLRTRISRKMKRVLKGIKSNVSPTR